MGIAIFHALYSHALAYCLLKTVTATLQQISEPFKCDLIFLCGDLLKKVGTCMDFTIVLIFYVVHIMLTLH